MKDAAKIAAELSDEPKVEAEVLREIIKGLEADKTRLRDALLNAQSFIQEVGTEDPDDIDVMADIERLSGKIAAALEWADAPSKPSTAPKPEETSAAMDRLLIALADSAFDCGASNGIKEEYAVLLLKQKIAMNHLRAHVAAQTATLEREVAELRKDRERLDWLEQTHAITLNQHGEANIVRFEYQFLGALRPAIDAALTRATPSKEGK